MSWGTVELEPEISQWLEALPTRQFARARRAWVRCQDEAHTPHEES